MKQRNSMISLRKRDFVEDYKFGGRWNRRMLNRGIGRELGTEIMERSKLMRKR